MIHGIDPGTTMSAVASLDEDGTFLGATYLPNEELLDWIGPSFGKVDWINKEPYWDRTGLAWHEIGSLLVERVQPMGVAAGWTTQLTVEWSVRFEMAFDRHRKRVVMETRADVLGHLGVNTKGPDGKNLSGSKLDQAVRAYLVDQWGGEHVARGGKRCRTCNGKGWRGRSHDPCPAGTIHEVEGEKTKCWEHPPGPLHSVTWGNNHLWDALACAVRMRQILEERG